MSVNTSEEYLDELLEAIEPIIRVDEPDVNPVQKPEVSLMQEVETIPVPDEVHTEIEPSDMQFEFSDEQETVEPVVDSPVEEDTSAISDLLSSLTSEEEDTLDENAISEEDIESMLNAVSNQTASKEPDMAYDADVKELLKQFTEDEDLSDIQDILDKNDNGEALDNAMLDLPDVEVFQLEEDTDEADENNAKNKKANPISKLIGSFSGLFKKRKNRKEKSVEGTEQEEISEVHADGMEELSSDTYLEPEDTELGISDIDGLDLGELLGAEEEPIFDEDMSDIEQLLTGGAFAEEKQTQDTDSLPEETKAAGRRKSDKKKNKDKSKNGKSSKNAKNKEKKESFFSKMLNVLTEELDEPAKAGSVVPEAGETGVTQENLNILEELSAEDKKKAKQAKKEEKQKKKAEKKGKNIPKKEEDAEEDGKSSENQKGKKAKKPKKKREKKEKPRKVEEITKPEKKLPRKRVISTFALCFSILAAVLILQNVVFKTDNLKEAKYAFDNGDYATCYANLESVERTEEEDELYQKSVIILSVQRKWDAYNNYLAMDNRIEALNSLLEGVTQYRSQEEVALEYGVHAQIAVIYQNILEALQGFGLAQSDIDEILAYESKVTYTKRLDSIVNGTPFVIEEMSESTDVSEPQPLPDVLPGEEDFLPDDTTLINEPRDTVIIQEDEVGIVSESQSSGETVIVGSNPMEVTSQNDAVSYEEPVVTGGQNVGNGSTNISSEVNGQNVLIGVR